MTETAMPAEATGASQYVAYLLNSLSTYTDIDPVLELRAVEVMEDVSDELTVYPSASTESDGSITLYWRGGNRGVEINIGPGDEFFYSVDGKYDKPKMIEGEGGLPVEDIRREVSDFSRFVYEQNPSWKDLFSSPA